MELENIVMSVTENLSKNNLPVYYKYRYTFDKEEQDISSQQQKCYRLVNYIKQHYLIGSKITAGVEHYTKGMMVAKPHCHIHFCSKHTSDTIRKGLSRQYEMIGRVQSCKAEVIVDEDKFFRYPLKQQMNETAVYKIITGFTKEQSSVMTEVAYACWKQSAEIYVGKIEKKLERTSKERLYVYLDSLDFAFESRKQVCCFSYQYFAENEDNLCIKTVDGYVNIYLLLKKHMSVFELFDETH